MKHKITTFILTAFLLCNFSLYAQRTDTRGTEFWLTFGRNWDAPSWAQLNPPPLPLTFFDYDLQIRIVAEEEATVNLYFTNLDSSVVFTVPANSVYTHVLTASQKQSVYHKPDESTIDTITNRSVRITASTPVSAYALNQVYASTDATNILPVTALGTDYYQISYKIFNASSRDAYIVVATQNDTKIYHAGTLVATLNTGEVYYRTSVNDMTGAHITTDKPVAFFAVNQMTQIPNGYEAADHLFQQLAPVNTWGKKFFVPVSRLGKDIVRVVASQNSTTITQTEGRVLEGNLTLNAGEFVEIEVELNKNGCYIEANKPVGVCTYLASTKYTPSPAFEDNSDPAQAWLPPVEQTVKSAFIAPFKPTGETRLTEHYALLVTSTVTKNNTRVKIGNGAEQNVNLFGGWYDHPSGMSFLIMQLYDVEKTHYYTNPAGFILMAYGIGKQESYYYLASSSMLTLDVAFYVNDIHFQEIASEIICTQPVEFRAEIEGDMSTAPGHLKWYINDVEKVEIQDLLTWSETFPDGIHNIRMEVLMENGKSRTVETNITIDSPPVLEQPMNLELCAGETSDMLFFNGVNLANATWLVTTGIGSKIGILSETGTGDFLSFTATDIGNVIITVTPKSPAGCVGETKIFTVTVNPVPVVDEIDSIILCHDEFSDSIIFNASHVTDVAWEIISGTGSEIGIPFETGTGNFPAFTAVNTTDEPLSITVKVTPISENDCIGEVEFFMITVLSQIPLEVNLGKDTFLCRLESLYLNATDQHAESYRWQDGFEGPIYTVFDRGGKYWVVVSNKCNNASDTINITYLNLKLDLGKDIVFCEDDIIYKEFDVSATNASSYLWQDGTESPVYIAEKPGIYSVTASNMCMSVTDEIEITTKDCSVLAIWFPNAFSPDGDGINDIFRPEINDLEYLVEYQLSIYNRWGNLIFTTQDYLTGWDGKYKNEDCSVGVYVGIVRYKNNEGKEFIQQISITLMR